MTGIDAISVPSQHQSLQEMGNKTVADLIGEDVSIEWNGIDGSVTGNIKYVSDYSELFGKQEKTGSFFPFVLDDSYKGKEITVQREGGSAKTAIDTEWILRLTDADKTEYNISCDDTQIAHLDFADATIETPIAVIPQDHNLGKFVKNVKDLVSADTTIHPDGSVTGTLYHIDGWTEVNQDTEKQSGNFLPVRLNKQYMTGKQITITGGSKPNTFTVKTESDRDVIIRVPNKDATFAFSEDGVEFMKLTFQTTTLNES